MVAKLERAGCFYSICKALRLMHQSPVYTLLATHYIYSIYRVAGICITHYFYLFSKNYGDHDAPSEWSQHLGAFACVYR